MEVIHKERIKLTLKEGQLLENSIALLYNIYDEASTKEIFENADIAAEAIVDLLNYCEPTKEEIENDESDEF